MPKINYEEFKQLAEQNNVKDVTDEEYFDHVRAHPKLSVNGAINRIKVARRSNYDPAVGKDTKTLIAYALGGYEYSDSDTPIKKQKSQYVTVLTRDHEVQKCSHRGGFTGKHGRLCEFELFKDPNWIYWAVHGVKTFEEQWKGTKYSRWVDINDMIDYVRPDKKEILFISGTLRGIYGINDWKKDKNDEWLRDEEDNMTTWNIDQSGKDFPVASALIRDEGVAVYANFGPYNNAEPLVKGLEDWSLDICDTFKDLAMATSGQRVGIVGEIFKVSTPVNKSTNEQYKKIEMQATAIIALPDAPTKETAQPEESKKVVKEDTAGQKKADELMGRIQKAYDEIGPEATVDMIRQASEGKETKDKYVEPHHTDLMIRTALDMIKEKEEKGDSDAGDPPIGIVARHIMKYMKEHKKAEVDNLLAAVDGSDELIENTIYDLVEAGKLAEKSLGSITLVI